MKQAWHCPFCNAHHAPHIDTCPNQNSRSGQGRNHPPIADAIAVGGVNRPLEPATYYVEPLTADRFSQLFGNA